MAGSILLITACSDAGLSTDAGLPTEDLEDEIGTLEQAYSAEECATAAPDSIHDMSSVNFIVSHTTPNVYSNPNAFKSYIWQFRNGEGAAHINSVNYYVALHQTSNGAFRPTHSDTKSECEGLRLLTRAFFNGRLLWSESNRGVWDFNGCYLPRETPPLEIATGPASTVRVCASARHANGTVIPMRLHAHGLNEKDLLYGIDDPRVPFTTVSPFGLETTHWEHVGADPTSAAQYCIDHGFNGGIGGGTGACRRTVAKYDEQARAWTGVSSIGCQSTWLDLSCY